MARNKYKITKYHTGKTIETIDKEAFNYFFEKVEQNNHLKDRSDLLKNMGILGDRKVPLFIHNAVGQWINPYFVFQMVGQHGLPADIVFEELEKKGIKVNEYWYEWCDFWLDTFLKGDMKKIKKNFILD